MARIVYAAGVMAHLSESQVSLAVEAYHGAGVIISDAVAQTIAAWWHSANGESAFLSTQGRITTTMTLDDFVSPLEYSAESVTNKRDLDALKAYIQHHQIAAGMTWCEACETLQFCEYGDSVNLCSECAEIEE